MNAVDTKLFIPEIPAHWTDRVRSGHRNIWNDRSTNPEMPETILEPPVRGLYAERYSDGWYWVNGCATCLTGVKTDSYIVCHDHNRCASCGVHRDDIQGVAHGTPRGFVCAPCYESDRKRTRDMAIERARNNDHDEDDCIEQDTVICPVCAEEIEDDEGYRDGDEETCHTCGTVFTIELSTKYTTTILRKEEIT